VAHQRVRQIRAAVESLNRSMDDARVGALMFVAPLRQVKTFDPYGNKFLTPDN
jgi:hypothetical protein